MLIILLDIIIVCVALGSGELSNAWPLLAFIATSLHAIETSAFLAATYYFQSSLQMKSQQSSRFQSLDDVDMDETDRFNNSNISLV